MLQHWVAGPKRHPRSEGTVEPVSPLLGSYNDQLAMRFIEEIDFDYAATNATAALLTAAA